MSHHPPSQPRPSPARRRPHGKSQKKKTQSQTRPPGKSGPSALIPHLRQRSGNSPGLLSSAAGIIVPFSSPSTDWIEKIVRRLYDPYCFSLAVDVDHHEVECRLEQTNEIPINLSTTAVQTIQEHLDLWYRVMSGPLTIMTPEEIGYHMGFHDDLENWVIMGLDAEGVTSLAQARAQYPEETARLEEDYTFLNAMFPVFKPGGRKRRFPQLQNLRKSLITLKKCCRSASIQYIDQRSQSQKEDLGGPFPVWTYHVPDFDEGLKGQAITALEETIAYHYQSGYNITALVLRGAVDADWATALGALSNYCQAFDTLVNSLEADQAQTP